MAFVYPIDLNWESYTSLGYGAFRGPLGFPGLRTIFHNTCKGMAFHLYACGCVLLSWFSQKIVSSSIDIRVNLRIRAHVLNVDLVMTIF